MVKLSSEGAFVAGLVGLVGNNTVWTIPVKVGGVQGFFWGFHTSGHMEPLQAPTALHHRANFW